ncbi:MAG: GNAT family N-acetyltransferase [Mariprofundaceae bacterium]
MQHAEKGISRTFVLIPEENKTVILGYYTLTPCQVCVEKLGKEDAKDKPKNHPLPAGKLARLAVASGYQNKGLGTKLLVHAMEHFLQAQSAIGMCALFVDAIDEEAASFYERFGFIRCSDNPLHLYLPTETIREAFDDK